MEAASPLLAPQKKEMRVCGLPEEIMVEILLRLPPESLIRFKCVCKSWYALITNPSFADEHLHLNNNRRSSSVSLVLSWIRPLDRDNFRDNPDMQSLGTIFDNDDDDDDDDKDKSDHIPCVVEDLNLSIIGHNLTREYLLSAFHCNGIICLSPMSFRPGEIVLYNPTIREFKILSKASRDRAASLVGEVFGYDSKSNDYKFMRILVYFDPYECMAELYSMAFDSWREIQIDMKVGPTYRPFNCTGVCCKGVFYWRVRMPDRILSFDMSNEEFHTIPLPVPLPQQFDNYVITLAKWNDSVALLISESVSLSCEIWVINEYHGGSKASWTKHLTIRPLVSFYTPLMFWKSNELLMVTEDGVIVSYNLNTQKFRNLPIRGVSPLSCGGDFYINSLVSVKAGN